MGRLDHCATRTGPLVIDGNYHNAIATCIPMFFFCHASERADNGATDKRRSVETGPLNGITHGLKTRWRRWRL